MTAPRHSLIPLFILVLVGFAPMVASAQAFSWKMALVKTTHGGLESVPFGRPVALKAGDQFQLVVVPEAAGYLDVLYEDGEGRLQVLSQGAVQAGQFLTLPSETTSFTVTPPAGTERLHVVLSRARLTTLDERLKLLPKGAEAVLDALAAIKNAQSTLAEIPEKPVPMGGVTRGIRDAKVTEFSGLDTYVKTIKIVH